MIPKISPRLKLSLLDKIQEKIWKEYQSYKKVRAYITQWQEEIDWNDVNFTIYSQGDTEKIDLNETLIHIEDETILKIAVDLGISTPDFIPIVAEIENTFKVNYYTAQQTFSKSLSYAYEKPDDAISLANSALESIIKHILMDEHFQELDRNKTLYKLTIDILKEFKLFPPKELPTSIRNIIQSLLTAAQNIEDIRSNNTDSHGKLSDDYLVNDPLYAFFIINSVSTIGLFFIGYYEKKYKPEYLKSKYERDEDLENDVPF